MASASMALIFPEILLGVSALGILLGDLWDSTPGRVGYWTFLLGVLAALAMVIASPVHTGSVLGGRFAMSGLAAWLKILFLGGAALCAMIAEANSEISSQNKNEFYLILLFSVIGACFLVSAQDLVTLYVSLELAGIPLYLLAAWRRDAKSAEAGLKYLILGSLASALLLYGMALVYGLTGTTDLALIASRVENGSVLVFAMALIAAGGAFKVAAAPFHFWAPDVYEGAPTSITAYLSVVSKGIALALLMIFFYVCFGRFLATLRFPFAALAAITMTWGNVAAIRQKNVKRLLAFSGISQAGYLLFGFIGVGTENLPTTIYYLMIYLLSNLAVFLVLATCAKKRRFEVLSDFRGLSRTSPGLALSMTLALFSLAGIPPLSGFVGKFFLFSLAAREGMHWLVALAAINSTVSLYYYLGIVREIYIEKSEGPTESFDISMTTRVGLWVTVGSILVCGVFPWFYQVIFEWLR